MTDAAGPIDVTGRPVRVGDVVRVLKIADFLARELPADEFSQLQSMVGQLFPITRIDEWGGAWVEMASGQEPDDAMTHQLMLSADEMELVTRAH